MLQDLAASLETPLSHVKLSTAALMSPTLARWAGDSTMRTMVTRSRSPGAAHTRDSWGQASIAPRV